MSQMASQWDVDVFVAVQLVVELVVDFGVH